MDSIYIESGKVLELIQLFEKEFKEVTLKYNIKESDDKRSLSNMASFLLRENVINEEEYSCIKKVIEIRNIVIHRLFIDDEYNKINKLKEMKESINITLDIFKLK